MEAATGPFPEPNDSSPDPHTVFFYDKDEN
jgi:hypothetical protein